MDAQVIASLINLAGGALGLALIQGLVKWLRGHYNAVQRATEGRSKAQAETRRIRHEYDYLRAWILSLGLTTEQLTKMPRPPDDK